MGRTLRLLTIVCVAALALTPAAAWAAGNDVIRDCTDNGRIDGNHGPQDYAEALSNLPTDVDEYTDCREIISSARRNPPQAGAATSDGGGGSGGSGGGSGGSGGGSGGSSATAASKPRVQGPHVIPPPSTLGASRISPGLPVPVIVILVLLGLAAIAGLLLRPGIGGARLTLPRLPGIDRVFPRRA